MIELNIPGLGRVQLQHLVCDVNGTLAVDGQLLEGIARPLTTLRDRLELHLLTADTHGKQHIIDQRRRAICGTQEFAGDIAHHCRLGRLLHFLQLRPGLFITSRQERDLAGKAEKAFTDAVTIVLDAASGLQCKQD